ncbi:hypothetical protein ACA910_012805 [Epithemia clementina (nom. ined.)]
MLSRVRTASRSWRLIGSRTFSTLNAEPRSTTRPGIIGTRAVTDCWSSSSSSSTLVFRRFKSTAALSSENEENGAKDPISEETTKNPFVPTPERKYEFFQNVEITDSGVAIVRFDCMGKSVNAISFALADEAKDLWTNDIESNNDIKAVVFTSAKPNTFIVGADIYDIKRTENKQDLIPVIEGGLKLFHRMRAKGVPLVCAVDGPALGGGLEWCLWCDYRICTDNPKTKMGLPEMKLGLLPGFGGTQNLPRLIGLRNALDMMLTGKDIRPDKAKKMGLVDLVVAPASLEKVAIDSALGLANKTLTPKRKGKSLLDRVLEDTSFGRSIIWSKTKEMVMKETNGKYPAPLKIIDCVKYGLENPKGDTKFKYEREQFAALAATPESEALVGIFDGMNKIKKHEFSAGTALPVETIAVMGAGLMGAGIAQISAEKGFQVLLKDRNDQAVARGESYMTDNWNKKVSRKRMTHHQFSINTSNVTPLTDDNPSLDRHFARADMVIEAVFEDLELKRKIVADIESRTPDRCIFATNTSAIPIASIAQNAQRPDKIIGMHYFSPVPAMMLMEIIPHQGTSESTIATAFEVGTKQGKTCIVVKDVPGFYVNRCFGPYLVETAALLRDGASLEGLDKAIKNFGMPVGPISLADDVGIDIISHVATFLSKADLGVRMEGGDVGMMKEMMEKGWLGKKSGEGFYTYKGKKKTINPAVETHLKKFVKTDLRLSEEEIQNRLVSRFVNEAAKCLEDEIIANPVVGDIGLVFGTGFAPFRGGPFRYLDQVGVSGYLDMMNGFADKYGPQFEPCQLLKDHAATNKKFHP